MLSTWFAPPTAPPAPKTTSSAEVGTTPVLQFVPVDQKEGVAPVQVTSAAKPTCANPATAAARTRLRLRLRFFIRVFPPEFKMDEPSPLAGTPSMANS